MHKPKKSKSANGSDDQPTADELASQKVQQAPLDLSDPNAKKPKQKGEKTRYSAKPKVEDTSQPYLGKPESTPQATPPASQPAAPATPAATPPGPTQP